MEEVKKTESNILESGVIDDGYMTMCSPIREFYPSIEELPLPGFTIEDDKQVVFNGTPDQIAEMLADYAKYFEEVENPENSASNPFFKSKYAPLATVLNTIRPILGKYGFGILQSPKMGDNGLVQVQTILTHRSGATISFPNIEARPAKNDVQGIMSIITYLRRASVNAVLGICGEEDDDGNSNSNKPKSAKKETPSKLSEKEQSLKKELITLCSEISEKDQSNKAKVLEALKEIEPTGNPNKIKSEESFQKAIDLVKGLNL